ncbi:MAG: acriflavine resistance protein B, partial [Bradyrhizobiaceae bacterium]
LVQRIAQVPGVGDVSVSGAEQPAVRVRMNPGALAAAGISLEDVRTAIADANTVTPLGGFENERLAESLATNEQLRRVPDFQPIVVKAANGTVVRLSDIASIEQGTRNSRSIAWFNGRPAVLLTITQQGDANVIETVDAIKALIPELQRWIPAGIEISILADRTGTIRASVADMQWTLAGTIALVMLVVFLFLRRAAPTAAAGVTVPLSLAGTCACMWLAGFSINNLTLMALAVSVGFVVDDAIVMIENVFRNLEKGHSPLRATIEGARQIGFTVVSISISLVAAFIPLLFLGGVPGRLFREFSVTLVFAILISMAVSLSVTPMIAAHYIRAVPGRNTTMLDRLVEGVLSRLVGLYAASLGVVLRHQVLTLVVMAGVIALTGTLYVKLPKGFLPRDDTGLIFGGTSASPDISFSAMRELQRRATELVMSDPAVAAIGSTVGGSGWSGSVNRGRMFISLKPAAERGGLTTQQVVERMRRRLGQIPGLRLFLVPAADIRVGGRSSDSQYQFTLWSADIDELYRWVPRVIARAKQIPGLVDVTTDREQGGLQLDITIDREAADRLGVPIQAIDAALNNAFAQRQVSTVYTQRNQYRVILEVDPRWQRDPNDLARIHVTGTAGEIPLATVARFTRGTAPLVVNHQGQFPSVTMSFDVQSGTSLDEATTRLRQAVAELRMPDTIRADFAGDARALAGTAVAQLLLILAALVCVYIVLGVLYESLAHPLTIISTLPSAGLGALLALQVTGMELGLIAFIGIILLIGLVKKNGIMLVDFALEGERQRGLAPARAIYEACLVRFRPILMTTMAALLGAVPLVIATGPGSELRRPLGITIIGGLIVSQVLTLYTTPVIYLLLDRLHHRLWGRRDSAPGRAERAMGTRGRLWPSLVRDA